MVSDCRDFNDLAYFGGKPVYKGDWPAWPRAGMSAQRALLDVLHGCRWSISAKTKCERSYINIFAQKFAAFIGRRHGVCCSSGSAALRIALIALGVKAGDEVIVSGLTWVAVASCVMHLGAVPVLVDVNKNSLVPDPQSIESLITPVTKAVIATHMYSSRVNMAAISDICTRHSLQLIEDASQAHGATLYDKRAGSYGTVSVFSFQQTKLLTSGEGGIALTDDEELGLLMQRLRTDGRLYGETENRGYFGMDNGSGIMGSNLCMSEFHAAILLEGLARLDSENVHRASNKKYLESIIQQIDNVSILQDELPEAGIRTYYKLPISFQSAAFENIPASVISKILTSETDLLIEPLDQPLSNSQLINISNLRENNRCLPISEKVVKSTVFIPHYALLGIREDVDLIFGAITKLNNCAESLSEYFYRGQQNER